MSRGRSNLRRGSGRIRREIAGKAIVLAMSLVDRPEWLPEGWTVELRKRSKSCLRSNRIDRYYICPLSGKKLRSRMEVMHYLNIKVPDQTRASSLVVMGERLEEGWMVDDKEKEMIRGRSNLRQWSRRIRREMARKAIVSAMSLADRPEWLPENWTVEFRKRGKSCLSSNRIDRYYICPLSGKKLRSRLEVMRFLNVKVPDRTRSSSLVVTRKRPEWLPEGWLVEFRKRKVSNTVDKYYICPLSGIKFRSRLEVMRFLNNEMLDCPASGSAHFDDGYKQLVQFDYSPSELPDGWIKENRWRKDGSRADSYYIDPISGYGFRSKKDVFRYLESKEVSRIAHTPDAYTLKDEFLPIQLYKKSKVKRTVARRRLFAREKSMSNASTDVKFMNPTQKLASSLGYSSPLLEAGASEISCSNPANVEHVEQSIFQIEWRPDLAFHGEGFLGQPAILLLPGPGNEILPLMQLEGERLLVIDANLSEEKQLEVTKNQNQPKGLSVGDELQEQPAIKIPKEPRSEKLSEPLMQLKGKRSPGRDGNLSEDMQFEMNQKLSELKRHTKPKKHGIGEEIQRQPAIKIIREPGDEKLSGPLVQLGGEILPVLDANFSEGKQFELAHEQSQHKMQRIGEELRGQAAIKVPTDPGNEELLNLLEGETLQVPDANLSEEKLFELTEKQSQPKRHGAGREHLGQPAINVVPDPVTEKLSDPLMQLEGERCPVPDANQSEEKQFELTEKLSQFKRHRKPKKHGISKELHGWSTIKVVQEPGSEKLLESLMQLECERPPVPNANLTEEKKSQPKRHGIGEEHQEQQAIKVLQEPVNEKLLESSMQMGGEKLPVPDAKLSEEVQFEMNQKLSQLKRRVQAKRCGSGEELQGKTGIKILREPRNEKLSEPFIQLECEAVPVQDANAAEEEQFELTEKLSQLKRRSRGCPGGSRNTGPNRTVRSGINQPSQRKRKAEKANTEPIRTSKRLAGVTVDPISKCGTGIQSKRATVNEIEQPQSIVPKKSEVHCWLHNKDALLTDELQQKLERLKPFVEQASQQNQPDQPKPTVPTDSDAGCLPNQKDTPITNELLERLERLKPFVEQASQDQQDGQPQPTVPKDARCGSHLSDSLETDQLQEKFKRLKPFSTQISQEQSVPPLATIPFGDSWLDPCIEFAFKTLTSDFPILEDVAAIQDYFNNQLISCKSLNASAGSIPLALDGPSMGNGKVQKNCQQNRGLNH